jgi:hypothetical protein
LAQVRGCSLRALESDIAGNQDVYALFGEVRFDAFACTLSFERHSP